MFFSGSHKKIYLRSDLFGGEKKGMEGRIEGKV